MCVTLLAAGFFIGEHRHPRCPLHLQLYFKCTGNVINIFPYGNNHRSHPRRADNLRLMPRMKILYGICRDTRIVFNDSRDAALL